ncbi:unnamed protein product [Parnassius apollo]|uniref:(apollo) hypothetical protein n=1 Tax=Parnassius apollo TaxID=110799 RepID=A0A8S3XNU6_PARAO|nr:unnamed protein product [Parnassius apollo]
MGDRKPSRFLRHLQGLAGIQVSDDFMKTLWISRLPSGIQTFLAGQPHTSIETLADVADRIHDLVPSSPQVASISHSHNEPVYNDRAKEVAALRKEVQALTLMHRRSRPRSRSKRDTRKDRSSSRSQSSYRKFTLCWYHSKFGEKADKCVRPCDYRSENSKGNR